MSYPQTHCRIRSSMSAAQRIGVQLQQTALTVDATPQKSRCQNATEFRNAQLSVVRCKPLLGSMRFTEPFCQIENGIVVHGDALAFIDNVAVANQPAAIGDIAPQDIQTLCSPIPRMQADSDSHYRGASARDLFGLIEKSGSDASPPRGRGNGKVVNLWYSSLPKGRIVRSPNKRNVRNWNQVDHAHKDDPRPLLVL